MTRSWLRPFPPLDCGALRRAAEPAETGAVKVERGPFKAALEAEGVFIPAQSAELGFWPLAYVGELRVVEVAPHGAAVKKGDILLRLDAEKAEDLVREARWALRASERQLADARSRREEFDEVRNTTSPRRRTSPSRGSRSGLQPEVEPPSPEGRARAK